MKRNVFLIIIISILFAYIESSIVVYLREAYYENGFPFPLKMMAVHTLWVEIGREMATLLFLAALAWLAGKNLRQRFAYFALAFGVWDIFYYIWLYVFLQWPESLLSWDLLFLIPIPWTGPVLSPILVSLALINIATIMFILDAKKRSPLQLTIRDWLGEGISVGLILLSYFWNISRINCPEELLHYPWSLLIVGLILGLGIIYHRLWEQSRSKKSLLKPEG